MSEFRITGRNVRPQRSENESENVVDLPPFPPMRTPFSDYNQNPRSGLDHESTKLGKTGVSEIGSNLVESLPLANRGSGLNLTPRSCRGKLQFEPNSGPNTPTRCTGRLSTGCFAGGGRNNPQSGSKGGILLKTTRGISSCAPASPGVEVPHFALEEDGSFWTDHNVQVLLRIRPISKMEKELHGNSRCLKQENAHTVTWLGNPDTRFTFDHIAGETIIQDMLFKVAGLPMVENCMSGYNSCMFAYGQTGSGKTYTMMGELYDANDELSEDRGMTPRIFEYLFARTKLEESSRKDEKLKYSCKCSFLEIYNEQITDLLEPSSTNLQLREDLKKGVYVENLRELEVETVKDVLDLLFQGTANRKVAATSMNSESSRSHSVFTCVIESRWEKDGMTHFRFARLNLVDLAGSERQKSSGADGERLREAANINKSLSTLGLVIMTLVDVAHGKHRHVPYRDSRLTFLLQDSLGGNSKTTIIANVSPSISCAHETLSTLKFAQRAKLIQNNAKVNEDASGDVVALQRQIQELKDQLSYLEHQNIRRPLSFHSSSFCYEKVNGFLKSCGISHGDPISEATPINDGSSLGIHISNKKLKQLEAMLVGSLRREKMAETTVVQLKAEMEQINRLCNQREEDSQRMKATIRHRDEKIRRLELLADSLQPADEFLMEENIALRQEIQFLQAKIDRNPELTQFSLENIRLLEQLRMFQDFYEKGEKEILLAEVSELRNQILDVFDKRDGQARDMPNDRKDMDHSIASEEKESLRIKVLNAVEELEDIKKSISAAFKANTRLAREVDELFVQVKESLNSAEPATEANPISRESDKDKIGVDCNDRKQIREKYIEMEKTSQTTNICKENMSHKNDQDCKVMASSLELEELLNAKEEAWSLLETLEAQQVHLVNELADLREENSRNLGTSSVTECKDMFSLLQPVTFPQQVEVCSETFESISKNDTVSSESKQNLISPVNIENMNMIFEDIEKQSHQSSLASQPSDLHDMGDVCNRLQEADQMVLNLQAQITVLQHEIDKKSDSESISRKKLMLLRTENEELQNKLSLIIQENIRLTEVLEDKEEKFTALAESEKEADSLINSLMDGCHALEDASGQVSSILDLFPERRIGEDEQVTGAIMAAHEKEKVISDLQTKLESAQKIGYRTNTELSCLKEAIMAITNAQMLENVEKCNEAMNLRKSLHDKTCLVHILEDKIKHQQDKLVEANRRANASFVFAGWLLSMNALQQKNKEGAHMHKPMTDTLHESISKWNQNSELSEAVLYIQSMQRHTENLEKEVEELKLTLSPNNIRMGEGQEPKVYAEEKEKHKLQSRSESQKYCIPEDLISFSHQDIEKSRFLEAEDFLLNSKQRRGGMDVFCHQNSELPILESGHAASFAAERSNEAQSLLMKFGEAQETMKEADDVLNALLDAYEAAKHETVRWKKLGEDLMVEKAALIQQVQELKDSIQLKEQEYANIEDHFQTFMSEANDSLSLFENFFIHIKKSSSEFSLIHSDVSTFIQELLVSIRMLNSSTESVSLMILENKFALSTINHCLLDFTLQNTSLNTADSGCFYLRHSEVNGLADSFGETSMPTVKDNRKIEVINDTAKGVKRGCSESKLHVLECMGGMDMAEHVQSSFNGEDTDVDVIFSSKRLSLENTVEHENGMAALLKDVRLMQDIINHLFIYLDRIGPCVNLLENVSANEKLADDDVMEKLLKTNSVSAEFARYNTRNDVKEFHEVDRSSSRANDRSVECHAGLTLEEAPFLADFQSLKNQCADLLVMLCGRSEDRHTCPWWRSSTAKQGQENDGLSTKRVSVFSNSPISSELCVPLVRGLINLGDKLNHLADSIKPAKPNGPNLDVTSHKVEKLFQDICNIESKMNTYHAKISDLDKQKTCLLPENLLLSKGLNHRDLVMEGLLFDLRLLQESKSDAKDRKDEAEEMSKTLRKTRNDLAIKAANIDGILARQQKIEEYLTDKETAVAYLQSELADKQEALELMSRENAELRILLDDLYVKKHVFEEQLVEQQEVIESLKKEIVHISSTVEQKIVSSLKNAEDELLKVITERDSLHAELATISGQLETALSLADENEAMAIEAQQVSEASKIHAEQKEEEARVLEQSVEELEHTINMLETKVYDMSKEVEIQKLIREELELEMQDLKLRVLKTQNDPGSFDCKSSAYHEEGKDNIISRYLEERRNELMEAKRYIRMLQNEKEDQAEQIAKYQAYISELVLHSEAQASQFQEKYKALEAMACDAQHRAPMAASAAKRTEKTPVRTRASGSPFKCITGLVNQMHSDREHELHVARRRMEELESLAANRQKEVCSLNARLAVAESMTHDVIRDLLGVKLDLSTYASLLDQQVVQKLAETAQRQREENRSKEDEILMLRGQLDDFMEERERLIEENNQKKSEVLDSQVKLEQLKHRQQLLTAQNELLQMDKQNLKKKVEELDEAVKSFSSSHEIQQSVHHHSKYKENRQPRVCNDELDKRLKNSEKILSHVKDELAHYRIGRGGKAPAFGVELLKRT